ETKRHVDVPQMKVACGPRRVSPDKRNDRTDDQQDASRSFESREGLDRPHQPLNRGRVFVRSGRAHCMLATVWSARMTTSMEASAWSAVIRERIAKGANASTSMGCQSKTQPIISKPYSKVVRASGRIRSVRSLVKIDASPRQTASRI